MKTDNLSRFCGLNSDYHNLLCVCFTPVFAGRAWMLARERRPVLLMDWGEASQALRRSHNSCPVIVAYDNTLILGKELWKVHILQTLPVRRGKNRSYNWDSFLTLFKNGMLLFRLQRFWISALSLELMTPTCNILYFQRFFEAFISL